MARSLIRFYRPPPSGLGSRAAVPRAPVAGSRFSRLARPTGGRVLFPASRREYGPEARVTGGIGVTRPAADHLARLGSRTRTAATQCSTERPGGLWDQTELSLGYRP